MVAPHRSWVLEVRPPPSALPTGGGWLHRLVDEHGPTVQRMLRRMLGNEDEARDVYHDCICHLAERTAPQTVRNSAAYACQTAANLATERLRRRQRRSAHWDRIVGYARARSDSLADDPARLAEDSIPGDGPDLHGAVSSLPVHLRDVVVLRDLLQLPYSRVSQMLGIQPTTARVYRRQALIRLGAMLQPGGAG